MAAPWAMITGRMAFPMPMADPSADRATFAPGASPPPCGEGMGVGGAPDQPASPPPHPSPQRGGSRPSAGGTLSDPALDRLRLTQILSPAFPIGSFAHSQGLELAMAAGWVATGADLQSWIAAILTHGAGHSDAVFLSLARRAGADMAHLSALYDALLPSAERGIEAAELGRGFQTLTADAGAVPLPYILALGRETAGLALPEPEIIGLFLQSIATQLISAAVRFLPLGQAEGQRILQALAPTIAATAQATSHATEDDLLTFTPGTDIASMAHETLETRIFRT